MYVVVGRHVLLVAHQGGVAQVVGDHDAGIEGAEVERGYGHVVVALDGLDDRGALELVAHVLLHRRYEQVLLLGLAQQLRDHLDLLAARQQVAQRHARHTRHLHVVDDAHELLDEPQRQVGVLEAVDGQAASRLLVAVLQVGDDRVMHVLLLLLQEQVADGVEAIAAQLVVAHEHEQEVEDDATLHVDLLVLASAELIGLEDDALLGGLHVGQAAEKGQAVDAQRLGPIEQVVEVEVLHIVAGDDVRIDLAHKVRPLLEHGALLHVGEDLRADDVRARVEREYVAYEGVLVALALHHVGDLDDRVLVGLGKDALAAGALDVEREYAQRRDLDPLALGRMRDEVLAVEVDLELAAAHVLPGLAHLVQAAGYLDPVAADDVVVAHEADLELDVALVGGVALHAGAGAEVVARLEYALDDGDVLGQRHANAQELGLLVAVEAVDVLLGDELDAGHGALGHVLGLDLVAHGRVEALGEPIELVGLDGGGARRRVGVQVRLVAVQVSEYAVAGLVDAVQAEDGHALCARQRLAHRRTLVVVEVDLLEDERVLGRVDGRQRRTRPLGVCRALLRSLACCCSYLIRLEYNFEKQRLEFGYLFRLECRRP